MVQTQSHDRTQILRIKDNKRRLLTAEEIKQKIVGCRRSKVLDFNAVIIGTLELQNLDRLDC